LRGLKEYQMVKEWHIHLFHPRSPLTKFTH
jgi:hypothetical protein